MLYASIYGYILVVFFIFIVEIPVTEDPHEDCNEQPTTTDPLNASASSTNLDNDAESSPASSEVSVPSLSATVALRESQLERMNDPLPQSTSDSSSIAASGHGSKRRWDEAELVAFNREFKRYIKDKEMAPGSEIVAVQKDHLKTSTVAQIRTRLNNLILGKQNSFQGK